MRKIVTILAGGLSSGAVSGIVIGVLLVVVVTGLVAAYVLWIKNQGKPFNCA